MQKYRVALKVAKDPRVQRLPCTHAGTYADDCICQRVTQHRCYIVATCDKDLRRRLRKVGRCFGIVACPVDAVCCVVMHDVETIFDGCALHDRFVRNVARLHCAR